MWYSNIENNEISEKQYPIVLVYGNRWNVNLSTM